MRRIDWNVTRPRPGRYAPDGRSPDEAIAAIRSAPVEIGYGDDGGIRGFDQADLEAIVDGLFIHNHPPYPFSIGDPRRRAGSFSPSDLAFMYEYRLTEVVAVTHERTYALRRPLGGFFLDPGEIRMDYSRMLIAVRQVLDEQAALGLIPKEASLSRGLWADLVMESLAMYYDYEWTEVEP